MSGGHPTPDPAGAGDPTSAMAAASRLAVLICLVNPAEGGACCESEESKSTKAKVGGDSEAR